MNDSLLIGIRFALYADLMLIAGLAAFPLYALAQDERAAAQPMTAILRTVRWLCIAGLLLSFAGMGVIAASMQGVGLLALDPQAFWSLVRETEVGTAWIIRSAILLLAAATAFWARRQPTIAAAVNAAAGSVAVATLAWSGHAGATEGTAGVVHRISDIVHMIAAAIWVGAIGAFLILTMPGGIRTTAGGLRLAARCLDQFSRVGTICVLAIAATGLLNAQMIIGAENILLSIRSPYGQLLLAKLVLFALMLALAAANRWRLVPVLTSVAQSAGPDAADAEGNAQDAVGAMRKSLIIEAAAALAILALVAWFGTLEPFVMADQP